MKIAFVGMSHLGINYAVASAAKGFHVICYDGDKNKIENLKKNIIDFYEPRLKNLLNKYSKNISFVDKIFEIKVCDLIFLSEDVRTNKDNFSIYKDINFLKNKILSNIKKKSTLIILSQVEVGFTEKIKINKNQLYYQVETLIFGNAVERSLNPQQFIIGAANNAINKKYHNYLKKFKCPITIMSYSTAELSKISINLYLISSLSFTNSLVELCEKKSIDWKKITTILRRDKRIGNYAYLNPGLGILSGNLQRDLQSFKKVLKQNNCNLHLPNAWQKNSDIRKKWVIDLLKSNFSNLLNSKKKIGIYGLTYKKNITFLKNSPALDIICKYKKTFFNIFDPKLSTRINKKNIKQHKNIKSFLRESDLLIILTDWDDIKNYDYSVLKNYNGKDIIDPYQTMDNKKFLKNKNIYILGKKNVTKKK